MLTDYWPDLCPRPLLTTKKAEEVFSQSHRCFEPAGVGTARKKEEADVFTSPTLALTAFHVENRVRLDANVQGFSLSVISESSQ